MHCEIQLGKKLNGYDIKVCMLHRKANSYGMPLDFKNRCECCGKYSSKEPLGFNFQPFKIYYSGSQLPGMLIFIKGIIFLFMVVCLVFSLPLCLINSNGQGCNKIVECNGSFFLTLSVFNSFDNLSKVNFISYMSVMVFFAFVVVMIYIRKSIYRIDQEIGDVELFQSSYYLLCQLPGNSQPNQFVDALVQWSKVQLKQQRLLKQLSPQQFLKQDEKIGDIQPTVKKEKKINSQKQETGSVNNKIYNVYLYSDVQENLKEKQIMNNNNKQNNDFQKKSSLLSQQLLQKEMVISNRFLLIIFKSKILQKLFFYKNNPSLLQKILNCSSFRPLLLNKKRVQFTKNLYPASIYWQNQQGISRQTLKQQIPGFVCLILSMALNACTLYGIVFVYNKCVLDQDDIPFISNYFNFLTACISNGVTLFFNKMMGICAAKQKYATYTNAKVSIILKILVNNLMNMYLFPFLIFQAVGNKHLWVNNGYLRCLNWTLVIYMIINLVDKFIAPSALASYYSYYSMNQLQNFNQCDANMRYTKPGLLIHEIYASILTVVFLSLLIMPFSPYMLTLSLSWFFLKFWSEKLSIAYFYAQDEAHGSSLTIEMIKVCEFFFLPLVYSFFSVLCVFGEFSHPTMPTVIIIISVLLLALGLLLKCSPVDAFSQNYLECFFNSQKSQNGPSVSQDVDKTFFMNFNNLKVGKLIHLKQKQVATNDEKLVDQTSSIQRNLTQSLKQRAINRRGTILQKQAPIQQSTENNEYFQYQKKIEMKKAEPKIKIPSLFHKSPNIFSGSKQQDSKGIPQKGRVLKTDKLKVQVPNLKVFIDNNQK